MDFTSNTYIFAQIFAFAAMVAFTWSQQCKKRRTLLLYIILGNSLNAVHFFLLGAITGTVLAVIGAIRFGVSIFSTNRIWLLLFLIINTIAAYLVFEGFLLSGTSYLAATFIIISSFLKSDHWMRVALIIGSVGWLVYGVLIGSLVAIVSNGIFLVSSIAGWYRHVYLVRSIPPIRKLRKLKKDTNS